MLRHLFFRLCANFNVYDALNLCLSLLFCERGPSIYNATIFKGVRGVKKNEDVKVSKVMTWEREGSKTLKN